ncbi:MAG TPA: DUF2848 domain-containing protein [Beijerinckiaceae bacterium]|jgi:hypothetical protein
MAKAAIKAELWTGGAWTPAEVVVDRLIIAGWTGRDAAALEKHIKELEELGVARPASTPIFYRVSAKRLTTDGAIEATGGASSGEVEYVLLGHAGKLWVGVGSDHTDREAETYGVTVSKQMCDKPVAPRFWPYEELADHWDQLVLRSFIEEDGARKIYQEGAVSAMLDPKSLLARGGFEALPDGAMMFCGTLAAKGGIRPSARFSFMLEDPVLKRSIEHAYSVETLPVLG